METLREQIIPDVHSYLIEGWWEFFGETLDASITPALGKGASIVRVTKDTLGIDDVRTVTELQSRKSQTPDVYILGCRTITREAQNALLKVSEEPTVRTYFFVIVPFARVLVPTLRSRLFTLTHESVPVSDELVDSFLSANPNKRLQLLETIIKDKDRAAAHMFFDALLAALYERLDVNQGGVENDYKALEEIMQARQYMTSRGSSLKLLLEHIALVTS